MNDELGEYYRQTGTKDPMNTPDPQPNFRYTSEEAPTVEDLDRIAQSDFNVKAHNSMMGVVAGAGVEIGTGLGLSYMNSMRIAKNLNRAKTVAVGAMVTPEIGSTVAGVIGFAASEMAIWGFSNFLGQTTRKGFGIQDNYSGGEMIAASVFGVGVMATKTTQGVSKLIQLGPSIGSMKGWKSMPIAREGAKTFVSGAGLGLAESLLRQEIQIALNERETRDVVDYMVSGAMGGSFNTLFSVFGRTGLWGINKAMNATAAAKRAAEEALERAKQIESPRKRAKEVAKLEEAIRHLDEVEAGWRDAGRVEGEYRQNAPEQPQAENPSGDPRQAPKLDPLPNPKPDEPEVSRLPDVPVSDEFDGLTYKQLQAEAKSRGIRANQKKETLLDELRATKKPTEQETPIPEQTPETDPLDTPDAPDAPDTPAPTRPIREEIEELAQRVKSLSGESLLKVEGELTRQSTRLAERLEPDLDIRLENISDKYTSGKELTTSEIDELITLVDDLRTLNQTRDLLKTATGRGQQGFRSDSDRFVWESSRSYRAVREDIALMDLEHSLGRLKQGRPVEGFNKQIKQFSALGDDIKKEAFDIFVKKGEGIPKGKKFEDLSPTERSIIVSKAVVKIIRKKQKQLEAELNKQRALMMDGMDVAMNEKQKSALKKEVEKRLKENPTIQMMDEKLKYYKQIQKEADQLAKAQAELTRLTNIEAEGSIGQIKGETKKPTSTKTGVEDAAPSKLEETKRKIKESKARMRDKIKDIERAELEMQKLEVFLSMQSYNMRSLELDATSRVTQWGRNIRAARKMALIDQLPSVFAGVPTGVGLSLRSAIRPFVMAPVDYTRYGGDVATKLFVAELQGLATTILNWNGTLTSMGRTFQKGNSATDRVMSKYMEDSQTAYFRTGSRVSIDRAVSTAKARMKNQSEAMNRVFDIKNDGYWAVLSLGIRGISAIDDGFRRQILRGRLDTASRRKAILENPTDAVKAEAAFKNYQKTMWSENNGLEVLTNYKEFIDDVNDINQNLLFAAQMDDPEMFHVNMGERLIKMFGEYAKGDDALAFAIDAFLPYISVPVRGVYRGARFAASPLVAARGALKNPYQTKINNKQRAIESAEYQLLKLDEDSPLAATLRDQIKNAEADIKILKERKTKYFEDAMVDMAFGVGLVGLGAASAMYGQATGSLNWLTKDQKDKNKLESFKLFGMDYSAAQPWSVPIAIGADIAAYIQARDAGALSEKQNVLNLITASLVEVTEQVPMFEGFKTFNAIVSGGMDTKVQQINRLTASYIPIPAQIRKTLMAFREDGTIGDLRGGTFAQRQAYAFFGVKPANKRTDYFGEDKKSSKNAMQLGVIRQYPSKPLEFENEFERVLASDVYDNVQPPPSSLGNKIKMTQYINDEGITLQYAYNLRLRNFKMNYKGRKMTLKQAVNKLMRTRAWRNKYEDTTISPSLTYTNEGLRELNQLLQSYYRELKQDIIDDDKFTKQFVNSKDETLYSVTQRKDTTVRGIKAPLRELMNFK